MRFVEDEHAGCLTYFSLAGMAGSSQPAKNVSSTSMGWGGVSCCNVSLHSALGLLLDFFIGFGGLAMSLTFTGTSLIPLQNARGTHSTNLVVFFARRFGSFRTADFRVMEKEMGWNLFSLRLVIVGPRIDVSRALGDGELMEINKHCVENLTDRDGLCVDTLGLPARQNLIGNYGPTVTNQRIL